MPPNHAELTPCAPFGFLNTNVMGKRGSSPLSLPQPLSERKLSSAQRCHREVAGGGGETHRSTPGSSQRRPRARPSGPGPGSLHTRASRACEVMPADTRQVPSQGPAQQACSRHTGQPRITTRPSMLAAPQGRLSSTPQLCPAVPHRPAGPSPPWEGGRGAHLC